MKVFYNSKIAKAFTFIEGFSTIMLFGAVFTEKESLNGKVLKHEETHCRQYVDCFAMGLSLAVLLMFLLFAVGVSSWNMLWLLTLPVLLFYVIYGIEYVINLFRGYSSKEAYKNIGFEKQAVWCADTWNKPCDEQNHYYTLGWWS